MSAQEHIENKHQYEEENVNENAQLVAAGGSELDPIVVDPPVYLGFIDLTESE